MVIFVDFYIEFFKFGIYINYFVKNSELINKIIEYIFRDNKYIKILLINVKLQKFNIIIFNLIYNIN